jgi:hypothetical protein
MWDFIDKAFYINLDHREDRRNLMVNFFKQGNVPNEKVERISAVSTPYNGMIGCAKSHIAALENAKRNNYKAVLIAEDDLEWVDFDKNYPELETLIQRPNWDVCMLTGFFAKITPPNKINVAFYTNCYIVKNHYYDTLLANMKEGLALKEETLQKEKYSWLKRTLHPLYKHIYNVDTYWIKLQLKDNWIGVIPQICRQTLSYSDINKQVIQPNIVVFQGNEYSHYDIGIMDYFLKQFENK